MPASTGNLRLDCWTHQQEILGRELLGGLVEPCPEFPVESEKGADLGAACIGIAPAGRDQFARKGRFEQQVGQQPAAAGAPRAENPKQGPERAGHRPSMFNCGFAWIAFRQQQQRLDVAHAERRGTRLQVCEQRIDAVEALEIRLQAFREQRIEHEPELLGHVGRRTGRRARAAGPVRNSLYEAGFTRGPR